MKEEYKHYRKSIKGKYKFSAWNGPAYQEDFKITVKPKVALFLFGKVLEELEWGIGELDDHMLIGVRWNKKQRTLQTITVEYKDPVTLQIRSESDDKNWMD